MNQADRKTIPILKTKNSISKADGNAIKSSQKESKGRCLLPNKLWVKRQKYCSKALRSTLNTSNDRKQKPLEPEHFTNPFEVPHEVKMEPGESNHLIVYPNIDPPANTAFNLPSTFLRQESNTQQMEIESNPDREATLNALKHSDAMINLFRECIEFNHRDELFDEANGDFGKYREALKKKLREIKSSLIRMHNEKPNQGITSRRVDNLRESGSGEEILENIEKDFYMPYFCNHKRRRNPRTHQRFEKYILERLTAGFYDSGLEKLLDDYFDSKTIHEEAKFFDSQLERRENEGLENYWAESLRDPMRIRKSPSNLVDFSSVKNVYEKALKFKVKISKKLLKRMKTQLEKKTAFDSALSKFENKELPWESVVKAREGLMLYDP